MLLLFLYIVCNHLATVYCDFCPFFLSLFSPFSVVLHLAANPDTLTCKERLKCKNQSAFLLYYLFDVVRRWHCCTATSTCTHIEQISSSAVQSIPNSIVTVSCLMAWCLARASYSHTHWPCYRHVLTHAICELYTLFLNVQSFGYLILSVFNEFEPWFSLIQFKNDCSNRINWLQSR